MTQKTWSLQKKIIVTLVGVGIVLGIFIGIIYGISLSNRKDVLVIPVDEADYGEDDESSNTMDGEISTGTSQIINYDPSHPVKEFKVKKGDRVKKGDILLVYDTTQLTAELDQKTLDARSVELELQRAQETMNKLNSVRQTTVGELEAEKEAAEEAEAEAERIANGENVAEEDTDEDDEDDSGEEEEEVDPAMMEVVFVDSEEETYSAVELRKAKLEAENNLRSLTTDMAEANAAVEAAQKAIDKSVEKASLDGVVNMVEKSVAGVGIVSLDAPPQEQQPVAAIGEGQPMLQVSTYEGLFVNTAINEWMMGRIKQGSKIYVKDWDSGKYYPAKVTYISKYSSEAAASRFSTEDTTDSFYALTALIEQEGTKLSDGNSVEVSFVKPDDFEGEEEDEDDEYPIYLYKAFVVSEGDDRYVYKEDKNGKLKKQKIDVEGQETETYIVNGGITSDDFIAFPFGDNIREGANVVEGSIDELREDY